jgi:hypothetical protein
MSRRGLPRRFWFALLYHLELIEYSSVATTEQIQLEVTVTLVLLLVLL